MKKLAALVSVPLLAVSLTACSAGEGASKEDVTTGLTKTMEHTLEEMGLTGLDAEILDSYVKCIVDDSYESLSASTRDTLAKGATEDIMDMKISQEDSDTLDKSVETCSEDLAQSLMQ